MLTTLHLIRAGLASGLLKKEEIIDWADKIITRDEIPDIFFIDLALSSSKNINDIIHYISDYLNFESPAVQGRPLLGLLYKQYKTNQIDLEQTTSKLFRIKFETLFNEREENHIYWIDNEYDCAKHKIYGTIEDVETQLNNFLILYKDYSIDNYTQWQDLDKEVDFKLEQQYQAEQEKLRMNKQITTSEGKRPWWKFW